MERKRTKKRNNPAAKAKKPKKASYVISIRISDDELDGINRLMECLNITRVSDLMRQAIAMVKESDFQNSCRA